MRQVRNLGPQEVTNLTTRLSLYGLAAVVTGLFVWQTVMTAAPPSASGPRFNGTLTGSCNPLPPADQCITWFTWICTDTGKTYQCYPNNSWVYQGSISSSGGATFGPCPPDGSLCSIQHLNAYYVCDVVNSVYQCQNNVINCTPVPPCWVWLDDITGSTGPSGATGAGETGPTGSSGATGAGETGPTGSSGATGAGETGPSGATGATGAQALWAAGACDGSGPTLPCSASVLYWMYLCDASITPPNMIGNVYQCTDIGWTYQNINLIGPTGATGPTGASGTPGGACLSDLSNGTDCSGGNGTYPCMECTTPGTTYACDIVPYRIYVCSADLQWELQQANSYVWNTVTFDNPNVILQSNVQCSLDNFGIIRFRGSCNSTKAPFIANAQPYTIVTTLPSTCAPPSDKYFSVAAYFNPFSSANICTMILYFRRSTMSLIIHAISCPTGTSNTIGGSSCFIATAVCVKDIPFDGIAYFSTN